MIGDERRFWSLIGAWCCLLLALFLIGVLFGCEAPTVADEVPATEAQARAYEASYYWARQKGVRLDAVVFAPGPYGATAWALCGQHAIGWNEKHIEVPGYVDFDCGAAHESCHIYYRDNLPCAGNTGEKAQLVEGRARRCASALVGRQCSTNE